ncbi:MAG TPA: VanW family protein [Egibacteraceae bacterium]|nr:VanW family protein [Egibacteraceae bacterium]
MTSPGAPNQPARWAVAVAVVAAVVVCSAALLGWQWSRTLDGVLTGVHVDGEDVGAQSRPELEASAAGLAAAREEQTVVIEGDRERVEATRGEAGALSEPDRALEDAWRRGRRGVFASFLDHVRSRAGARVDVEMPESIDGDRLQAFAAAAADELTVAVREGAVELDDDPDTRRASRVVVTEPAAGEVVDAEDLRQRLRSALADTDGAVRVDAPAERTEPTIGEADVEAAAARARTAVSASIALRHPGAGPDVGLSPARIAAVLTVEADEDAAEGSRLRLTSDPDALREVLGDDLLGELSSGPVDAAFVVDGDQVRVEGGEPGLRVAPEALAEQVLAVALREDDRDAEMVGETIEPDFTREEAEQLGIREEVSTFTTEHACCAPRVDNIQLMADMVDGAVLAPGQRFSLNEHVGPRTRAKGFQEDGVIVGGEIEDQVGGGVSQFATTFFNAAFFAGIELVEHQPHSFYISRYPAGREATLAYNSIDVVIENSSPYGILVKTSYTDTSITVTFYSTQWVQVEARAGERTNVRPGAVQDGFDITVERLITYPDGETKVETYTTSYEPNDEGA